MSNTTENLSVSISSSWDKSDIQLRYSLHVTILLGFTMTCVALVTLTGNLLVIISIFTYRPLKNAQNVLLVSLAVADIGVAVLVMPLSIVDTTIERWFLGHETCVAWTTFDVMFCTASILNLCCIGLDRFQALRNPISYANKRTIRRMLRMILVVYGLSAVVSIPQPLFWHPQHVAASKCGLSNDPLYVLISASVSFFVPCVIMCAVYGSIYWKTRDRLRKRSTACAVALSAVANATAAHAVSSILAKKQSAESAKGSSGEADTPSQTPRASTAGLKKRSVTRTIRRRASRILRLKDNDSVSSSDDVASEPAGAAPPQAFWQHAITLTLLPPVVRKPEESAFATRQKIYLSRERKAAKILGLLIVTFMVSWIPFFVLYTVSPWCEICRNWHRAVHILATWIGYANSACNPILYTIFNADFRKAFHKLLCSCRPSTRKTVHLAKIWRDAADTQSRNH